MYPGYKLRDVLSENAITFFALLNDGYRLQYINYIMLSRIADLPNSDKSARTEFYRQLQWASKHPSDILNEDEPSSSSSDIGKLLGG